MLTSSDVRECFRIIGECRDLGADAKAWHAHLLARVCGAVDAQVGIGGNLIRPGFHRPGPHFAPIRLGWRDARAAEAWERYATEVPVERTPEYAWVKKFDGSLMTLGRSDMWDRHMWYRSATYNERHRVSGIDDYIMSFCPLPRPGVFNSLWVHRPVGARSFTRREWGIVNLIHGEVAKLIGGPLAAPTEPLLAALSPRLRQTLDRLLQGDSEKQAAAALGVTRSTLHEYVLALHRHFGVSSRGELLARFIGRARPSVHTPLPSGPLGSNGQRPDA